MKQNEQELFSFLSMVKENTLGFLDLSIEDGCIIVDLDARYDFFTAESIFEDCNQAQAKLFLESFVIGDLNVNWDISLQLSKLLSTRGFLISDLIEPMLSRLDWHSYSSPQLLLSYLAIMNGGVEWAYQLLDQVPEDARDGLLLACYKLNSQKLDKKLMGKFVEWGASNWSPGSTGELGALEQFISKWLERYPYNELEEVIRTYFRYC